VAVTAGPSGDFVDKRIGKALTGGRVLIGVGTGRGMAGPKMTHYPNRVQLAACQARA
jgi:hypothetical protein